MRTALTPTPGSQSYAAAIPKMEVCSDLQALGETTGHSWAFFHELRGK
jgi:hypothetical protein